MPERPWLHVKLKDTTLLSEKKEIPFARRSCESKRRYFTKKYPSKIYEILMLFKNQTLNNVLTTVNRFNFFLNSFIYDFLNP